MKRYREPNRTINFNSKVNKIIFYLGKKGFSVKCIAEEVNRRLLRCEMSECQVYYRLQKYGIKLRTYRSGSNPEAKQDIQQVMIKLHIVGKKRLTG